MILNRAEREREVSPTGYHCHLGTNAISDIVCHRTVCHNRTKPARGTFGILSIIDKTGAIPTFMAERIRLIVDTEERLRRAVRMAAARRGLSPSDIVNELIVSHLKDDVADAEKAIAQENDEEPPKKLKK